MFSMRLFSFPTAQHLFAWRSVLFVEIGCGHIHIMYIYIYTHSYTLGTMQLKAWCWLSLGGNRNRCE